MSQTYNSEDSVKSFLHVSSFDDLSPGQCETLARIIPQTDSQVAANILDQLPDQKFNKFGNQAIAIYAQMCMEILNGNNRSREAAIQGYQKILDSLQKKLDSENLSEDERKAITKDMIEVANGLAKVDESNKAFLLSMAKLALKGVTALTAILAPILTKALLEKPTPEVKVIATPRRRPFGPKK